MGKDGTAVPSRFTALWVNVLGRLDGSASGTKALTIPIIPR
jgi:hypothetical protein